MVCHVARRAEWFAITAVNGLRAGVSLWMYEKHVHSYLEGVKLKGTSVPLRVFPDLPECLIWVCDIVWKYVEHKFLCRYFLIWQCW